MVSRCDLHDYISVFFSFSFFPISFSSFFGFVSLFILGFAFCSEEATVVAV